MKTILLFICFTIYSLVTCLPHHKKDTDTDEVPHEEDHPHKHGHSQVKILDCDDTINGIGIDWDGDDDEINEKAYKCFKSKKDVLSAENEAPVAKEHCESPPIGYHVCLDKKISYDTNLPLGGPHRPVWVTYGEYIYMPPQRWVHAIEHGAAVFLYDPCADTSEIETFKSLAKGCLRRHVITPYNNLSESQPFTIVSFGCRLEMNKVVGNEKEIKRYLRAHAIKEGPEFPLGQDGDYKFGLKEQAKVITDIQDSDICPE